jgi:hypothetical protein
MRWYVDIDSERIALGLSRDEAEAVARRARAKYWAMRISIGEAT